MLEGRSVVVPNGLTNIPRIEDSQRLKKLPWHIGLVVGNEWAGCFVLRGAQRRCEQPADQSSLSSLGPNSNQLSFVIKLPNSLPQYDEAGIQVYLNSPTAQLYNSWVAYDRFEVNLGGSTVQATYALTTEQQTKLASAPYEDLQIRIEFHSPQSGTYVFDGFAGLPLPDPSKGECGLSPRTAASRRLTTLPEARIR